MHVGAEMLISDHSLPRFQGRLAGMIGMKFQGNLGDGSRETYDATTRYAM